MTDHTSPPPDGASALDFCLRLARAQALIVRRFDSILGNLHGLSFGDYQLLYHLQRAPGARAHLPIDKDAPLAAFEQVAAQFPVFRVVARNMA